jgi:hypothetical protein
MEGEGKEVLQISKQAQLSGFEENFTYFSHTAEIV